MRGKISIKKTSSPKNSFSNIQHSALINVSLPRSISEFATLRIFIVLLSLLVVVFAESDHCIWYGVCYGTEPKEFNCPYNGPGLPLDDEDAQEIMLRRCPELYTNCIYTKQNHAKCLKQ